MEENLQEDFSQYAEGLKKVRQRRWYLWGVAIIYLPIIWLSLQISNSDRVTAKVFAVWFLVACVASLLAAFVKCPRCGNYFHVNGFVPVYVRRCVNCGLPLKADKERSR